MDKAELSIFGGLAAGGKLVFVRLVLVALANPESGDNVCCLLCTIPFLNKLFDIV
jgi:hypothetical protein